MNSQERMHRIRRLLDDRLAAEQVEIVDQSALHAGHQQARGAGHFHVTVVSERFRGLLPVAAHRLVYDALAELMDTEIHALEVTTFTPAQRQRSTA